LPEVLVGCICQIRALVHLATIHREHNVPRLKAGGGRRRVRHNRANHHAVRPADLEANGEHNERGEQIGPHAGQQHGSTHAFARAGQTARDGGVVLPRGTYEAPEGDCIEGELCSASHKESQQPRRIAEPEFVDLDAGQPGRDEMAQLVDQDQCAD
jgi:hypothetical protein